jgi:hypothetical protein
MSESLVISFKENNLAMKPNSESIAEFLQKLHNHALMPSGILRKDPRPNSSSA